MPPDSKRSSPETGSPSAVREGGPLEGGAPTPALPGFPGALSGIVDISSEGIISIDEDHRVVLFNQGAEAIFGHRADEMLGRPLDLLIPEAHRSRHRKHVESFGRSAARARRMGERTPIAGLRKDGTEFPAEASISQLDTEDGKLYTVVIRDITDRRRTLDEQTFLAEVGRVLAGSLEYEDTLRGVAELTVRFVADVCAVDMVEEGFDVRRLEVRYRSPELEAAARDLREVELDRSRPHLMAAVLETRGPVLVSPVSAEHLDSLAQGPEHRATLERLEIRSYMAIPLVARDRLLGALLLLACGDSRPFDRGDLRVAAELGAMAGLAVDNARLYREARRAVQARDDILGVVSHDLGNPLQAIFIGVEALQRDPSTTSSEGTTYYLEAIRRSADHMERLIRELLEVRRMEAGELALDRRPIQLAPLVARTLGVMDPLARVKKLALEDRVHAAPLPLVDADADRIQQVLSNLVGNAVKLTPEGGRVLVEARAQRDALLVSVRDTGPGIPEHQRERVFERFWRGEAPGPQGIGLGLAIAKGIVLRHGGRIWLDSEPGEGSVFHFTLPLAATGSPPGDG